MEQIVFIGSIVIISLIFALLCYQIAEKRQADKVFWAIMGFLFGPFALPFLFFAKQNKGKQ